SPPPVVGSVVPRVALSEPVPEVLGSTVVEPVVVDSAVVDDDEVVIIVVVPALRPPELVEDSGAWARSGPLQARRASAAGRGRGARVRLTAVGPARRRPSQARTARGRAHASAARGRQPLAAAPDQRGMSGTQQPVEQKKPSAQSW